MKRWFYILMLVILAGCGLAGGSESMPPGPSGLHLDSTLEPYLKETFEAVKKCTQLEGEFSDLSVIIMPPKFICNAYSDGCSGEFKAPNYILLAAPSIWKHEVIHYLLSLKTGDPDPDHRSTLFIDCA